MTIRWIFAGRLLPAALLIAGFLALACAAPPPLPTQTPYPTQSPLPTLTPFPTWTPAPTATAYPSPTPYPTATAYPTLTPYPTATAYPTPTALPTPTPAPTWTPLPTHTPYPTPTALPTVTPAPTSAWPVWQTYRHNADRDGSGECDDRPNFEVELPPHWTTGSTPCDSAWFESSDAALSISILDFPNQSASPLVALTELRELYSNPYTLEGSDGPIWVTPNSTATIVHRGEPAIYHKVTYTREATSQYCTETAHRLIVPSQSWRSHAQKAIVVRVSRCESTQVNETDLMRMLYSFRLIAPY